MATLSIYYGGKSAIKAVGHNQVNLLMFLEKYRGWHSVKNDRPTIRAVEGLVRRGCAEFDEKTTMARFKYPNN